MILHHTCRTDWKPSVRLLGLYTELLNISSPMPICYSRRTSETLHTNGPAWPLWTRSGTPGMRPGPLPGCTTVRTWTFGICHYHRPSSAPGRSRRKTFSARRFSWTVILRFLRSCYFLNAVSVCQSIIFVWKLFFLYSIQFNSDKINEKCFFELCTVCGMAPKFFWIRNTPRTTSGAEIDLKMLTSWRPISFISKTTNNLHYRWTEFFSTCLLLLVSDYFSFCLKFWYLTMSINRLLGSCALCALTETSLIVQCMKRSVHSYWRPVAA